jgi:signal transduction histidine kinase
VVGFKENVMNNLDLIRKVDFLKPLSEEAISEISRCFLEKNYAQGTVLFEENDQGNNFYLIKSGQVTLSKRLKVADNIEGEISVFSPCEYFGELSLIDEAPRSGTATVSEDSVLLIIEKQDFLNICQDYPQVMFNIIKTISRRLRETNDKYIKMWDELIVKSKMAAIGTAAGKIVHDIKTPITIIVLTAQMIARLHSGAESLTRKIVKQVTVLDEMVREILEFARGEQSELNIEELEMSGFISELEESIRPVAESNQIELLISNSVSTRVAFDSFRISRTLINLFKNGVEAFSGEPGRIEISARIENDKLLFSVSDNGSGIPEALLDKLFEPFVTHGKKSGTGLGLAICQKVINDHKGQIVASNRPQGGARFDITLPTRTGDRS